MSIAAPVSQSPPPSPSSSASSHLFPPPAVIIITAAILSTTLISKSPPPPPPLFHPQLPLLIKCIWSHQSRPSAHSSPSRHPGFFTKHYFTFMFDYHWWGSISCRLWFRVVLHCNRGCPPYFFCFVLFHSNFRQVFSDKVNPLKEIKQCRLVFK